MPPTCQDLKVKTAVGGGWWCPPGGPGEVHLGVPSLPEPLFWSGSCLTSLQLFFLKSLQLHHKHPLAEGRGNSAPAVRTEPGRGGLEAVPVCGII